MILRHNLLTLLNLIMNKVIKNTKDGVMVSLGFLSGMINGDDLNRGAYYDENENIWVWSY